LDGPEGCLIEVLFGLALEFALWVWLGFLFHAPIMSGWHPQSRDVKSKLHHYR
jgi:hypothetical protein